MTVVGDELELKWNRKDLGNLDQVMPMVRQRRQCVQAGGCLGLFPLYLADQFDAIYTFEPSPTLFRLMAQNVRRKNVIMMQAALGAEPGRMVQTRCELRPDDGKTTLHAGMTRTEDGGQIPTIEVDALGLREVDLLYLDIEGDEMFALRGARKTIDLCRPVIACEVNRGLAYRGFGLDDVKSLLALYEYDHKHTFRSDHVFLPRGL